MKATQTEPIFKPVTITLETQHEVDALFAMLNRTALAQAVLLPDAWQVLHPYISPDYRSIEDRLKKFLDDPSAAK